MKVKISAVAVAASLALGAVAVQAQQRSVSGVSASGVPWSAQSMIVGVTSTATIAGGGNPIYQPVQPRDSGVAALIMTFSGGSFICTGTLLPDRQSIITAAHCVTDAALATPTATTAWFYGGTNGDLVVPNNAAATPITVSQYFVHPSYTGEVLDQNDIAVLRLSAPAPAFAASYGIFTGSSLETTDFTVHGYGGRSDTGGNVGANLGTGRLRNADNRYDFRLGASVFGTGWAAELGEDFARIEYSYWSDFDNGLAANDASCLTVNNVFGFGADPRWCNLGRGAREGGLAGGDSGGPGFVGGQIASINSYGITYGSAAYGDIDGALNSSFGEWSGYVPTYIHAAFINAALVPEPESYAMMALGLLAIGAAARRRQQAR